MGAVCTPSGRFKYTFFLCIQILSTEVLSIRISGELKREAEKLGIDVKSVVEKALADAVEHAKRRKLEEAINMLLKEMDEISEGEWVRVVKECRRER